MKKTIAIILAAVVMAGSAQAQNSLREFSNEVNVMYGIGSVPSAASVTAMMLGAAAGSSTSNLKVNDPKTTGSISLEYFHYTKTGRWAFGVSTAFEKNSFVLSGTQQGQSGSADISLTFVTVMPAVKLVWFNGNVVGMYSKLALGAGYVGVPATIDVKTDKGTESRSLNSSNIIPAFQFNPVCLEIGGKRVRGFLELGWGMQGLGMAGVKVGF